MTLTSRLQILFAHPFRLFFLLAGVYAIVIMIGWIGFLLAGWHLPMGFNPLKWHSHEMMYGFVGAAIAGFLLTAITNWASCKPLRGGMLAALGATWLAGRIVFWCLSDVPPWLAAVVDLSFWLFMVVYVLFVLIRGNNMRNIPIAGVLLLLMIGNGLMHAGLITGKHSLLVMGQNWGLDLIMLLMAIIGGRIIPAFSRNWLLNHGLNAQTIRQHTWLERASLLVILLLVIAHTLPFNNIALSLIALAAALLHCTRLYFWRGWLCAREPLLWSLHLAYLWLVISLWLRAAAPWLELPASLWQHTLAVGGMSTLILAVMTRVCMGHTGRPLALRPGAIWIYIAINGAAVLRLLVAARVVPFDTGLIITASLWVLAFGLFVILYAPILTAPRADGRAG